MQLFIVFILGAVVLGAGSMLSPAWRTAQPRIALSASLCLALVVGGAVFYASAFGWDTLVVDYLLFALMAGVVLGGTLSHAQTRAEAKGETLPDAEQGWPGPQDLAFFAVVAMIILIPLLNLPLPLGTNAQQLGFHTLIIRFGESFTSLAPFYPETTVIYAPGFHALSAYLSQQLGQSIPMIQMSITALVLYLCIWLAYDLGAEIRDKRLGRAMAIAMLLCGGLFISYIDGHFTELMALLFMMSFVMYALRFIRQFNFADMVAGGLMMGAVIYSNLTMSMIMILGFIPLCVMAWRRHRPDKSASDLMKSRLGLTLGFPLVALLGIAPWLFKNLSLIVAPNASPFPSQFGLLTVMIIGQGIVIVLLAGQGATSGFQNTENDDTRLITIVMLVWLALVLEFALLGIIGQIIPFIGDLINAPNIARHGVILPFTWLGGLGLLHLWETRISVTIRTHLRNNAYRLIASVAVLVIVIGLAFNPLLDLMRPILNLPSTLATQDDIAVMTWLKHNTPADAILYAVDDNAWLPILAERNALHFSAVRYFEWDEVTTPAQSLDFSVANLSNALFDYLFVSSTSEHDLSEINHLQMVYEQGTAHAYQITH